MVVNPAVHAVLPVLHSSPVPRVLVGDTGWLDRRQNSLCKVNHTGIEAVDGYPIAWKRVADKCTRSVRVGASRERVIDLLWPVAQVALQVGRRRHAQSAQSRANAVKPLVSGEKEGLVFPVV